MTDELDRFCEFAERFLTDESGQPLVIRPWQREVLADHFAGKRELVVLVSKKVGKTSIFAGVALWHLLTVPFADVAILAASREQAGKLLAQLTGYVKRSPSLRRRLRITQRVVHCEGTSGKVAVLAADSDTLDGWGGTLALVDELGRHKSAENFGLLRDGLGPRDGQLAAFSTAGEDLDSALGRIRTAAHEMPGFERDPDNQFHKRVRTDSFAFHEWSLDKPEQAEDLSLVAMVNPGVDEAELRTRRESPSMAPWQWQRFTCGLWVAGETSAVSPEEWNSCADGSAVIPDRAADVHVGLDLAWRFDTAAAVPVWRDGQNVIVGTPSILHPPSEGVSIDAEKIWAAIEGMANRWPGLTLVADPNAGAPELLQRVENELPQVRVAEHSQRPGPMALAAGRLQEAIASGRLRHPEDEELTRHVLAAVPATVGEGYRFRKASRHGKPIDALIALAMAISVLNAEAAEPEYGSFQWDN